MDAVVRPDARVVPLYDLPPGESLTAIATGDQPIHVLALPLATALPAIPTIKWVGRDERFDIIVLSQVSAKADLDRIAASEYLAPVGDISGAGVSYADFHAEAPTEGAVHSACAALMPIVMRIRDLPERVRASNDPDLLLLGRIGTRDRPLTAMYDPTRAPCVRYPVAGRIPQVAESAVRLSGSGHLQRQFFDRLHICPQCRSSRLSVREECTKCRSPRLTEERLIHHFRCAEQQPESRFRKGPDLVCPKCDYVLNHFGLDYDKPGSVLCCGSCRHVSDVPAIAFVCLDCGTRTDADDVPTCDWFHYDLTALGRHALRAGMLGPDRRDGNHLIPGVLSRSTFHELAASCEGLYRRAGRPFAVLAVLSGTGTAATAPK